jgi:hypothetical protein
MLRLTLLVSLLLALLLTACVQPTPTPESTNGAPAATDSSGYPAVEPSNTAPAAYPAVEPSATPSDYPAPSSRHLPALKFGAVAAAYR